MAKLTQKEWIVLLDKSPRGPLSEEEIGELLSKGILRRIDLAFLVPETPGEGQAQWKFLWQFPEFDARQKAKDVPPPAAVLEKRQPKTEEQITGQIQENIPLDLQTITIDDLILRANSSPKREFVSSSLSDEKERFRFQVPLRGGTTSSVGVLSAVFFFLAVAGFGYLGFKKIFSGTPKETTREVAQEGKGPALSGPQGLPKARSASDSIKKPKSAPTPPVPAPKERDRGEIREEEILRIREEERRQEAADRDRERQREEESIKEEDEESGPESKKRSKRRGEPASEENEDSSHEESNSSSPSTEAEDDSSASTLE